MIAYGINPVLEAIKAGRVERVAVSRRALGLDDGSSSGSANRRLNEADLRRLSNPRLRDLLLEVMARRVPFEDVDARELDRATRGGVHQGVLAVLREAEDYTPADLVRLAAGPPLLVVLDGIEDPHNVGAILRTADAAGVDGVVRQARRSAPLDGAVAKASAGAVAHVRVATVVNIARAVEELKSQSVWTIGLAEDGERRYDEVDFRLPTAFAFGAEGSGLRRLVRERCDFTVRIPMAGRVRSLNVSVAAGIVLFEARRQRLARRSDE
jgi:23S rRNA (guanosine2251-2'-O)-methyltransferase